MNISNFIGKTIKEIVIEQEISGNPVRGTLIIFDDNSKFMTNENAELFFSADGSSVFDDIKRVNFREFFNKL